MMNSNAREQSWPPFWQALPQIAGYPLRGVAVVVLGAVAVMDLLSVLPSLLGVAMAVGSVLTAFKYALEILRDTADGHREPAQFGTDLELSLAVGYLAVNLIALAAVTLSKFMIGPGSALLIAMLAAVVLPAISMLLAMSESLGKAINPAAWATLIARIGGAYWLASALTWLVLVVSILLADSLQSALPALLGSLSGTLLRYWALFASAHLMGYLLYQHHVALGYEPGRHRALAPNLPRNRDQATLDAADALLSAGNRDGARALLAEAIRDRAVDGTLHVRYRALLDPQRDRDARLAHDRQWLHQLVEERDWPRALSIAGECLALDPRMTPLVPEDFAQLSDQAASRGRSRLALDLLTRVIEDAPKHAERADWLLAAARLQADRFGEIETALGLLRQASATSTDPALAARIAAIRAEIRGVSGGNRSGV
jgi:tetratricopeptide (TPR) repeat protein